MTPEENANWNLLKAIVTANNQQDEEKLYSILADPANDFSNKPHCIDAALNAITLTKDNVAKHREVLTSFAHKADTTDLSLRSTFRYAMLCDMLDM